MAATLPPGPLPRHVGIIMDGNGRWAEQRGRPRFEGHAEGARSVRTVVTAARELGIEALTLYAFSIQNWVRPEAEVERLMELLLEYLAGERDTIMKNGIRLQGIGQTDQLPPLVRQKLESLEQESKANQDMVLSLALSYGGREEIVSACRRVAKKVKESELGPEDITEELLDRHMYTHDLPALDLLIRTSGEMRLSNFLLWQAAYAELAVTDVLWPDFGEAELLDSIRVFRKRKRRFGGVSSTEESC